MLVSGILAKVNVQTTQATAVKTVQLLCGYIGIVLHLSLPQWIRLDV